ncbi:hypothetical protein BHE74_00021138 [Ensete ventricosum]|nr:hypothetical protein GW17_00002672 [Ensete ventricosum]RWW71136.1 hypothetical protein BHE74_00021138 [Ensete ventricosum]
MVSLDIKSEIGLGVEADTEEEVLIQQERGGVDRASDKCDFAGISPKISDLVDRISSESKIWDYDLSCFVNLQEGVISMLGKKSTRSCKSVVPEFLEQYWQRSKILANLGASLSTLSDRRQLYDKQQRVVTVTGGTAEKGR